VEIYVATKMKYMKLILPKMVTHKIL